MQIVADENIALLNEFFCAFRRVEELCRSPVVEQVGNADVLLVRSVTSVNAKLLQHSSIRL